ncbi:MAG: cytochrome c maturation protein CcmE [Ignavibacteria bacterium]|nr:cytochrome c maturation protein CcmE [Ignavibacteria bacterium]
MKGKLKIIIGIVIIIIFSVYGFITFLSSKIDYVDFATALKNQGKEFEVRGKWLKEMNYKTDLKFEFYMKDDNGTIMRVVYDKPKPNNLEHAELIVVEGKVRDSTFYASQILTKCPSKYESTNK